TYQFTLKIHHKDEFSKPPERRYKFAELDYVDLVDSDMFSLYEWSEMLKELGNDVVIKEIVEDNVVSNSGKDSRLFMLEWPGMGEEEVVSISGKVSRLLILEWPEMGKEDEHANTTKHASTSDVCPVVEPINDENI
ncbi:hypothetical protein Tco_0021029, partial [Tanacetum coccineum]